VLTVCSACTTAFAPDLPFCPECQVAIPVPDEFVHAAIEKMNQLINDPADTETNAPTLVDVSLPSEDVAPPTKTRKEG
jgi:hypothetical protein